MILRRFRGMRDGDDGVALVMALVFITIVALFATVALTKNEGTSLAGQSLRERGKLQYTLDAGIERGLRRLTVEMASGSATPSCASAGDATDLDPVTLNDHTATVTCTNLGGSARTTTTSISNKALVVRSTDANSLRTYGSSSSGPFASATCSTTPSGFFRVTGPVYVTGPQNDSALGPPVLVCDGDFVQSSTYCTDTSIAALTRVKVATATFVRDCTPQGAVEASGAAPTLEARPPGDVDVSNCHANFDNSGLLVGVPSCTPPGPSPGVNCRVFYPGRYAAAPPLLSGSGGNYFASGTYWFRDIGSWNINSEIVVGAELDPGDTGRDKADTNCAAVSDALIAASAPLFLSSPTTLLATRITSGGGIMVFDGASRVELTDRLTVHSPPHPATVPATTVVFGGYQAWTPSGASEPGTGNTNCSTFYALCNSNASSHLNTNGRLWAPDAPFNLFASAATDNLIPGGAVVAKVRLGASTSGFPASSVSTFGSVTRDAPPYRTVRLVSSSTSSDIKNIVVAEISNFDDYRPRVFTWRTGLLTD
jgi:hypothetical protein